MARDAGAPLSPCSATGSPGAIHPQRPGPTRSARAPPAAPGPHRQCLRKAVREAARVAPVAEPSVVVAHGYPDARSREVAPRRPVPLRRAGRVRVARAAPLRVDAPPAGVRADQGESRSCPSLRTSKAGANQRGAWPTAPRNAQPWSRVASVTRGERAPALRAAASAPPHATVRGCRTLRMEARGARAERAVDDLGPGRRGPGSGR